MQTKLSKEFGTDKTVDQYIDLIGRRKLACSETIIARAHEYCSKITDYYNSSPKTQQALALLYIASREIRRPIPWTAMKPLAAQQHVREMIRIMQATLGSQWRVLLRDPIRSFKISYRR